MTRNSKLWLSAIPSTLANGTLVVGQERDEKSRIIYLVECTCTRRWTAQAAKVMAREQRAVCRSCAAPKPGRENRAQLDTARLISIERKREKVLARLIAEQAHKPDAALIEQSLRVVFGLGYAVRWPNGRSDQA